MKTFEFIRSGLVLSVMVCLWPAAMSTEVASWSKTGLALCLVLLLQQAWDILFCKEEA